MKIGLLGMGSIGQRHALNLLSMGHTVHWYDPWATKAKLPPGATRVEFDMSAIEGMDAVVIASPTDCHLEQLDKAIHHCHGGVFVEKPIAHDWPDGVSALLSDAAIRGRKVMVGNNLRFHTGVLRAKEWLDKEMIGKVHWASFIIAQFSAKEAYRRDGVILNWGAHEVDLALYLLGPASVASCVAHKPAPDASEDIADIALFHDQDVLSHVHLDYLGQPQCRAVMLMGEKGWIILDLVQRVNVLRRPSGQEMIEELKGNLAQDYLDEINNFIGVIEGKEKMAGATGEDGLRTLEVLLEAKRRGETA